MRTQGLRRGYAGQAIASRATAVAVTEIVIYK